MPAVLFASVPEPDRTRVLKACQAKKFSPGDVIFSEGDLGDSLYLVARGRLIIRSTSETGDNVTLDIAGPGAVVGLLGMVREDHRRTATVVALDDCLLRVLSATTFAQLRAKYPATERALSILLADSVERLSQQVLEAHYLPVEQRIARRLMRVAAMAGRVEKGTTLPLTQQDIADLAGAARPTTNQALKRLEAAGAVALSRGRISIVDPAVLDERSTL